MPNWCDNELVIVGSEEDIKKIKEQVINENGEFDFANVIAPPDHPDYNNEPIPAGDLLNGKLNWYNWNIDNWGTKWNASESHVAEVSTKQLQIWFQTAWSPALPVSKKLSEQYPDVCIDHKYIEEGNDFCGITYYLNGKELDDSWQDTPNHHNIDNFGRECQCEWNDEQEYWFDDCPREEIQNEQRLIKARD